jgi:hypothetical protein
MRWFGPLILLSFGCIFIFLLVGISQPSYPTLSLVATAKLRDGLKDTNQVYIHQLGSSLIISSTTSIKNKVTVRFEAFPSRMNGTVNKEALNANLISEATFDGTLLYFLSGNGSDKRLALVYSKVLNESISYHLRVSSVLPNAGTSPLIPVTSETQLLAGNIVFSKMTYGPRGQLLYSRKQDNRIFRLIVPQPAPNDVISTPPTTKSIPQLVAYPIPGPSLGLSYLYQILSMDD